MARSILVLGASGTGKSHSIQQLDEKATFLVNVYGKALPFRGWKKRYTPIVDIKSAVGNMVSVDDAEKIVQVLQYAYARGFRTIVVDDYQFVAGMKTIRDAKIKGYDKFTDVAQGFVQIADICKKMPDDALVFFLSHIEDDGKGGTKAKTAGRMVDNVIGLESLFTVVLQTFVRDGVYGFETQSNGQNTVKSPEGMFPLEIANDLEYVRRSILAYDEGEEMPDVAEVKKGNTAQPAQVVEVKEPEQEKQLSEPLFGASFGEELPFGTSACDEDVIPEVETKRPLDAETFGLFLDSIKLSKGSLVMLIKAGKISFCGNSVSVDYESSQRAIFHAISTEKGVQSVKDLLSMFFGYPIDFVLSIEDEKPTSGMPEPFVKQPIKAELKASAPDFAAGKTFEQKIEELINALGGKAEATAFLVSKNSLKDGQPIQSLSLAALDRLHGNLGKLVAIKNGEA
jgi:hypothetical protein